MIRLIYCLLLLPLTTFAIDLNDAIRDVAESKMSMRTSIYGENAEVVYVGIHKDCVAASIMWTQQRIENFRVCNGEVQPRNTVSPAWDESIGHPTYVSVINNAVLYGHASQMDSNGYLVSARTFNAVSHDCRNIEVVVSYDGDLVDRDVHQICGK
jgi:hypothetical protein